VAILLQQHNHQNICSIIYPVSPKSRNSLGLYSRKLSDVIAMPLPTWYAAKSRYFGIKEITLDERTTGVVAADLEGTLTMGATWKGIGRYLTVHGRSLAYRLFYLRYLPSAMLARWGMVDRTAFNAHFMTGLLKLFKGYTEAQFAAMVEWVLDHETWEQRRADVLAELESLRQQGHQLVIVSGAYQPVVEAFGRRMGAAAIGTPLEIISGRLTGRFAEPMNTGESKVRKLREFLANLPLVAAYGDTVPDIAMLSMSQSPVAVYPDEGLRAAAREQGWRILET
jgi:phosphoserine phosphatase